MPSWSSPECSPLCQGGGRGFKSHRGRWSGTVREPAERPSSNLGELWVRLPPVLLDEWPVRLLVRSPVSQAGKVGSIPMRGTG
jgi:hypothetical protein